MKPYCELAATQIWNVSSLGMAHIDMPDQLLYTLTMVLRLMQEVVELLVLDCF